MDQVYELHKTMLKNNLILVYEGDFSQVVAKSVLAMAEENLGGEDEELLIKRRVFNIVIECLQNISKYAEPTNFVNNCSQPGIFIIGRNEDGYLVSSGNYMRTSNVEELKDRLDLVNSLDEEGLKKLYKDVLKNSNALSNKGGAGLGFIDMARKSGSKLAFHFHKVDEKHTFFTLKTTVSRMLNKPRTL